MAPWALFNGYRRSSFLIEVDNTSILRTGALHCYHYTLNRLPAPRLLLPRSGLERSDFVLWPRAADLRRGIKSAAIRVHRPWR